MTQKELLYFEDAISHEDAILSYLEDSLEFVSDDVCNFLSSEIKVHQNIRKKLLKELEDKSNEWTNDFN